MDFKKLRAPFISRAVIKNQADLFRQKYWDNTIPVDIEKIIEVKLRINIIPTPGLEKMCNTDAFISSNWQAINVDEARFNDERYLNRLRFSLAHEIGHLILHKDTYESFDIMKLEDFYNFYEIVPGEQYSYFETQAHKFASYLLVPREKLVVVKEDIFKKLKASREIDLEKFDPSLLNSYLANPIGRIFGVSSEAMEIILEETATQREKEKADN